MGQGVWGGLAVGAVVGGGVGDDVPSGNNGDSSAVGGAKNINSDRDSKNGGRDFFRYGDMRFGCI